MDENKLYFPKVFNEQFQSAGMINEEEALFDFGCGMKDTIVHHGKMYISRNFIGWVSLMKTHVVLIAFKDVSEIQKKTTVLVPMAVEIRTTSSKYLFGSFLRRDRSYKTLVRVWQAAKGEKPQLTAEEIEKMRDGDFTTVGEEQVEDKEGEMGGLIQELGPAPSIVNEVWNTGVPIPPTCTFFQKKDPKAYKLLLDQTWPLDLKGFFQAFLSDEKFTVEMHTEVGDSEIQVGNWSFKENCYFERTMTLQTPINSKVIKATSAAVTQIQRLYLKPGKTELVVETSNQVSGVPYSDAFTVETQWVLTSSDNKSTNVKIQVAVVFVKSILLKSVIEKSTLTQTQKFYDTFAVLISKKFKGGAQAASASAAVAAARGEAGDQGDGLSSLLNQPIFLGLSASALVLLFLFFYIISSNTSISYQISHIKVEIERISAEVSKYQIQLQKNTDPRNLPYTEEEIHKHLMTISELLSGLQSSITSALTPK